MAALALPAFNVAIDLFVLLLALPKIASDLDAGAVQRLQDHRQLRFRADRAPGHHEHAE